MSRLIEYLGAILLIAFVVVLLLPATSQREDSPRTQCKNNLKQLGLALHIYHDNFKVFPPAYTVDEKGNRLHSWRTLILPYLDLQELYDSIDLSKPWNDPANAASYKTVVPVYRCPSTISEATSTTYMAVVTPNGLFRPLQSNKIADVTDGTANTLMLIEVNPEKAVQWMAPVDVDEQTLRTRGGAKAQVHSGGRHVALVDGSIRFLSDTIPYEQLHALTTINGNEAVGDF